MSDQPSYSNTVETTKDHVTATPELITPTNLVPTQTLVFASLFLAVLVLASP